MSIEAPFSKYKKTNFKIAIALCGIFAIIFAYDGYLSKYQWSLRRSFYEKHVKEGQPDDTMIFNRKSPFFLIAVAVVLTGLYSALGNRKLLADENELIINNKERISYDSIQKIDKTRFDPVKGYFIVTYKNKDGSEANRKISSKTYDNLASVLDELVARIS